MHTLISLPQEVLELICGSVAFDDLPSIRALAQSCKAFQIATMKHRFQNVEIFVARRAELAKELRQLIQILGKNSAFNAVRQLTVLGKLIPIEHDPETPKERAQRVSDVKLARRLRHIHGDDSGEDDASSTPQEPARDDWGLLPSFVKQLQGLRDFNWCCETLFPPCLLDILHKSLPRCELHIFAFKLPSLYYNPLEPQDISDYEFSLATSPSLSTIMVPVFHDDDDYEFEDSNDHKDGHVEYNKEAAIQLASGLAPNLKTVRILIKDYDYELEPLQPWQGFFPSKPNKIKANLQPGNLQELSLSPAAEDIFKPWAVQANFSNLQALQLLDARVDAVVMAAKCQFPSLKALVLEMIDPSDDAAYRDFDAAASAFISSLPPLQSIRFTSCEKEKTLKAILDRHADSLCSLSLWTEAKTYEEGNAITEEWITQIRDSCPNLCNLGLPIARTKGNHEEVQIYRIIAGMPHLTDLSLQLVCEGWEEDEDTGLSSSSFLVSDTEKARELLVSYAVDATLAREIFSVIGENRNLQRLDLNMVVEVCPMQLADITNLMHRRWRCIKADGDRVIVREAEEEMRKYTERTSMVDLEEYEPVFREVWPKKHAEWVNDWHSFPLQRGSNGQ
ncbi:hypothetical protein N7490_006205 [Penicillium lividum]|nr:hypothetical protein N7490_006205 [Penicillium lividum]